MEDTDAPDPFLQQVPLIRNPAFQPPKPVSLNTNYGKLLATLPGSVIPPKVALKKEELEQWIEQLKNIKQNNLHSESQTQASVNYTQWLKKSQMKVAPGFDFDGMTPLSAGHLEVASPRLDRAADVPKSESSDVSGLREDLGDLKIT
ncbi:hypothetical protein EJF18_30109 [Clavispora lusitaniae]|uniref:Uncharacterized protein n=1 Tax=Clavispora lusitaniae TaxID=36911 RepID=A0ACD0WIU8_CLALS|nr:hypothetical protein EJF14_30109 [Clavispora lusitaniae]QFZ33541.1 hypothetical protein EJF16_30109 [Clavispora lusitaniae]QFZ39212.1 hypothetical protein EJF15_30109 [Clavispora lusitaniae]QFZ44894.1 hypothetical protein EJF18_30109 [Clavispora lusitaniae]QFZ50571.1 hypothetical protein EJF17_30109 [Clavispora lusitaniae]